MKKEDVKVLSVTMSDDPVDPSELIKFPQFQAPGIKYKLKYISFKSLLF